MDWVIRVEPRDCTLVALEEGEKPDTHTAPCLVPCDALHWLRTLPARSHDQLQPLDLAHPEQRVKINLLVTYPENRLT